MTLISSRTAVESKLNRSCNHRITWPTPCNGAFIIIIIIIRSRRQQRSVASTQSGHDDEPWTIRHECWRVYRRRSAGSMNGAGVLAVAANQDQNGSRFLLLRPVIMRGGLACGHRVSPHGRTMNFVSWRWYPEHREGWSGRQLLCFWQERCFAIWKLAAGCHELMYARALCDRPLPAITDRPAVPLAAIPSPPSATLGQTAGNLALISRPVKGSRLSWPESVSNLLKANEGSASYLRVRFSATWQLHWQRMCGMKISYCTFFMSLLAC